MRAIRRFTVRAVLPEPLAPLDELVMNLRWSWHFETLDLFESIDPEIWRSVGRDPVRLLGAVSSDRLAALAKDKKFLRRMRDAADDLQDYLTSPRWYQTLEDAPKAIAYFSPEFGITEVLPQYSGGLGILAGDHLKAASDLGVPIIGAGLLYQRGYFTQSLSAEGWQLEHYPPSDPQGLPLTLLRGDDGAPLRTDVGLPGGRRLYAQIWKAQVGRVPLLLLDSHIEENSASEREVTDRLYGGATDHRLLQEMLLGIGGVRALRTYVDATGGEQPEVFHTNEGHAGFLGLERVRELTEGYGLSFNEALAVVRAGTVFTTHTPVPAGIDRFPRALIEEHFGGDNGTHGVHVDDILALGAEPNGGDPDVFNMAVMGLRLAQRANGVSALHGGVSREMFANLWPGFDAGERPIAHVTNGVHAPTWVARPVWEIAEREMEQVTQEARGWETIDKLSDDVIWATRRELRTQLVGEIRRRLRTSWLLRGASESRLDWIATAFDPDVLTIGFARRVPSYKRLTLMLRDPQRLTDILLDPDRPVQIVVAGKAHPADDGGKALVQQIVRFADQPEVRHRIAFLPDYDISMARFLYSGCDVWLNNPLRPLEACGTSGMKAALNGCLNLSIRDGWWDEMFDGENGWAIPSADGVFDPDERDDLESNALYDLIENTVRARFYERDSSGRPTRWIEMVRHDLMSLGPKVLAGRMLRDYVVELYRPAAESSRAMHAAGFAAARELAAWTDDVRKRWPGVRVVHVETEGGGDTPQLGASLVVRAYVELAGLRPEDVDVQVAFGPVDETDQLRSPATVVLAVDPNSDGTTYRYEGELALDRSGSFGYTVRVLPRHDGLASPAELALVTYA